MYEGIHSVFVLSDLNASLCIFVRNLIIITSIGGINYITKDKGWLLPLILTFLSGLSPVFSSNHSILRMLLQLPPFCSALTLNAEARTDGIEADCLAYRQIENYS